MGMGANPTLGASFRVLLAPKLFLMIMLSASLLNGQAERDTVESFDRTLKVPIAQQVIDAVTTPYLVKRGMIELDPIVCPFADSYLMFGLFKLGYGIAGTVALIDMKKKYPRWYRVAVISLNTLYALILINNYGVWRRIQQEDIP